MKVWNVSERELYRAAANADVRVYNLREDGRAKRFTLKLADSKRWQRTSASGFHQGRKVAAVCWHGHYVFMREVFRINENARIKTAWQDYKGLASFLELAPATASINVGSAFYPASADSVCLCADRGDDYIMQEGFSYVTGARVAMLRQEDVRACRFAILTPEHYRADGSCRCDDELEQSRLIRESGYTREDFRRAS